MALLYTYHGQRPREAGSSTHAGTVVDALPAQVGNAVAIADDDVATGLAAGLYEVTATSACGAVRHSNGALANAAGGKPRAEGWEAVLYVGQGGSIACDA